MIPIDNIKYAICITDDGVSYIHGVYGQYSDAISECESIINYLFNKLYKKDISYDMLYTTFINSYDSIEILSLENDTNCTFDILQYIQHRCKQIIQAKGDILDIDSLLKGVSGGETDNAFRFARIEYLSNRNTKKWIDEFYKRFEIEEADKSLLTALKMSSKKLRDKLYPFINYKTKIVSQDNEIDRGVIHYILQKQNEIVGIVKELLAIEEIPPDSNTQSIDDFRYIHDKLAKQLINNLSITDLAILLTNKFTCEHTDTQDRFFRIMTDEAITNLKKEMETYADYDFIEESQAEYSFNETITGIDKYIRRYTIPYLIKELKEISDLNDLMNFSDYYINHCFRDIKHDRDMVNKVFNICSDKVLTKISPYLSFNGLPQGSSHSIVNDNAEAKSIIIEKINDALYTASLYAGSIITTVRTINGLDDFRFVGDITTKAFTQTIPKEALATLMLFSDYGTKERIFKVMSQAELELLLEEMEFQEIPSPREIKYAYEDFIKTLIKLDLGL
ncbi:MAG: hypothetical protein HQK98_00860 [Nitrospirae bacterium]|nr:hypothetical protein [Nitrospirota bacterium]